MNRTFPKSFVWGCATSAFQVEGAAAEDGRGLSVWDTFCKIPGNVKEDHTPDVSADQYHRYPEDVAIMQGLGANAYRLSISWSRVLPDGEGRVNEAGMAYYERLVDALLAAGITPYITLFHWDLPQALEDRYGGWTSRETSKRFADYAALIVQRLSDRVQNWFTMNEFSCFTSQSYGSGECAPGRKLPRKDVLAVNHNALLGHGLAVQAIRAHAKHGANIGLAENVLPASPIIETPEHIAAAEIAMREANAAYLTPILEGAYTPHYLKSLGADAPVFTDDEMRIISAPLGFVGLNCYGPYTVRAADNAIGYEHVPSSPGHPRMNNAWMYLDPQCLYWAVRNTAKLWNVKSIHITENGCSALDRITRNAATGKPEVLDTDRVMYLRAHLKAAERAVQEGLPLHGYFLWSLLDNFEWGHGYTQRFGLVYVNFTDLTRIPKLSAEFYRQTIAAGRVV